MKKRALAMTLILVLVLSISTLAFELRAVQIYPNLTFSGNYANCDVTIVGNSSSDSISATIRLKQGNSVIRTWTATGTGDLEFEKSTAVSSGYTYTLAVDATINGTTYSTVSTSKTLG